MVNVKALTLVVVGIRMVAVNRKERELRDELEALTENVVDRDIVRIVIVGIESQHATGKGVHHIGAGRLEDHIAGKALGKRSVLAELLVEAAKLLCRGKTAEKKKVNTFLKAESSVLFETVYECGHVHTAVEKLTGDKLLFTVFVDTAGVYLGYLGKTCKHAASVDVTKTSLNVVLSVHIGADAVGLAATLRKLIYIRIYFISKSGHFAYPFAKGNI
jgi:hypothetical protein